jgi:hypothetical protein
VGGGDARVPFYRVGGGAGRPGVRGEWVAAVVRHNGGGGGHVRRGLARVVVVSDEGGGCSGHYGSGRGTGRQRRCVGGGGSLGAQKWSKEERWEEGILWHPFIGSEGEWGGRASEGNGRW